MTTATTTKPDNADLAGDTTKAADVPEFDTDGAEIEAEDQGAEETAESEAEESDTTDTAGDDSEFNEEDQPAGPARKLTIAEQQQTLIQEIIAQREKVRAAEADVAGDQEALKESKSVLGKRQATLGQLIDRLEEVSKGQLQLPYRDYSAPNDPEGDAADSSNDSAVSSAPAEDIHGQAPVSVLKLPKGMLEKLEGADIETIQDLEQRMAAGDLVPSAIKGIGQTAVDKISDALVAYRAECPIPA